MVDCVVHNWEGEPVGNAHLDLKAAREGTAVHLLHAALVRQQANQRQGTASTRTRSEVRGGGRKPFKQKGTGRARQGSIRTPLRPGGGVVFGPKPRSYAKAMNRKERRLALRTALMSRAEDWLVVQEFNACVGAPRTRDLLAALERWGVAPDMGVLLVLKAPSEAVIKSARNVPRITLIRADQLNVFDLLHADKLVFSEDAVTTIQEVYSDG
ncbi:MAG: 50S ribosomal protein L4 [Cyanobacteria bacterium MAG CAR3_bin_5]|nr:50S ribosomal protein L4 [Cyanobacteria bacterium MAG CAR3_bin_5]MCY4236179.1 50S ribosomal protein L4 [Cyanobacteria bacterium MAG CAR2_bin_4]